MDIKKIFKQEQPFFLAIPAIVWQVMFLFLPISVIVGLSVINPQGHSLSTLFTLENFKAFFAMPFVWVLVRSLLLAFVTASLCLILAFPVAYFVAQKVQRGKNILLFFLILPFWTSLLVHAYSWFFILEKQGLINTILTKIGLINSPITLLNNSGVIYLVMIYCYLPFMILPLYSILEKIDKRLLEASADLGANTWNTFVNVTLPLAMPGIRTGFFLVFVPSFGEFVIPSLLGGGKQMYVGSLISHYFLVAQDPYSGAAFTTLSGLVLIVISCLIYFYFKKKSGIIVDQEGV